jgi:GT2 family glycosyltransferase
LRPPRDRDRLSQGPDIVIPTHGGWALTESCLRHLEAQSVGHRVIVVDNGSPDGTPDRVRAAFPATTVIALEENRGFAAACNRGIAAGDAEIVVLLNNDVDCRPDFVAELLSAFADRPRLGAAAPLLVRPDGETIDSVGLAVDRTLAGFPRLQGHAVHDASANRPALVGPVGAAAAYRRAALADTGPLDERIFMYAEDVDLALRMRAAGWSAVAVPEARAVHMGSASAGRRSAWQRRNSGFARGYLLRRYGVLRSRAAARALATEAIVAVGDAVLSRDAAALRGRLAGWRAGRRLPRRRRPAEALATEISFLESLRLRRADYALAGPPRDR